MFVVTQFDHALFSSGHFGEHDLLSSGCQTKAGAENGPMFVTCHVLVKEIGRAVPRATHLKVANLEEGAAETENWG